MKGLAQLAGIWCSSPDFHQWLFELGGLPANEDDAIEFVYLACEINSRSELDSNERAARLFVEKVRRPFREWLNGRPAAAPSRQRNK
ncbi:hypothetical protein PCO31111_04219 [Pandoraea communis]|uniref:Uncharacterized protein n=1 Tax=Pandoraea communis TaxID=2508297 RepID=A0A5E4Y0R6_9BURK|nr:hypothetical protein [Pandoraea communis]VVE41878.1 hypothetical protein PCO31111_04219 [Pandoraea communis]